jgi:DNA ligase-1
LIEETPYMGAKSFSEKGAKKLFDKLEDGGYVISQIKADGTYRNNINQDGEVELLSRQGEVSFLKGTKFLEELSTFGDCVLNGELTIDGYERYEANGMVSSIMDIIEKGPDRGPLSTEKKVKAFIEKHGDFDEALQKMRFTVWDMITVDEYYNAKSDRPYKERFIQLQNLINEKAPTMVDIVETRFVTTFEEAMEHFLDAQARGLEGTIIKAVNEGWKDGKPTYQIKMKLEMNVDLRVVQPVFGTEGKKYEDKINGFILESSCGTIRTTARGVKEAEMDKFTELGDKMIGEIIETKCCGLSQNEKGEWSLLHPSVVEHRTDKNTCDSFESAQQIEEMAKTLKEFV